MGEATPEKLVVCMCKINPSYGEQVAKFYESGVQLPAEMQAIRRDHVLYCRDLVKRGILWIGGPSADLKIALNIFAVDSVEEAREIQRNDPSYIHGRFYDDEYFEWTIHEPFDKVSPVHKEGVIRTLKELGISPEP